MNALDLHAELLAQQLSVVDATDAALTKAESDELNCLISYDRTLAMEAAAQAQQMIDEGNAVTLTGVPYVAQDSILFTDGLATAGSQMLYNFRPPFGATVVDKLNEAGLIPVGKANMGELNIGGAESSYFGAVQHPIDSNRVSGGVAAAVASGIAPLAIGVDCDGTLRREAAQAGLTCIKPTYGTVSRFGVIANMSSGEQISTVAADVAAAAALLTLIAGHDDKDGTSRPAAAYDYAVEAEIKGKKIALIENYLGSQTSGATVAAIQACAEKFRKLGAIVETVKLQYAEYAHLAMDIMASAEGCNNISRFDGVKYGYRTAKYKNIEELYCKSRSEALGLEVKKAAILGTYVLAKGQYENYYLKALQVRRLIREEMAKLFADYDLALTPVSAAEAYAIGEDDMGQTKLRDSFYTAIPSITGLPAVSLPIGLDLTGLPIGGQLIANEMADADLIAAVMAYQQGE